MNVANVVILLGCRSSGCSPTEELKGRVKERESEIDKLKRDSSILEKMKGKSAEYIENTFREYL